jgi:hypothetical protein
VIRLKRNKKNKPKETSGIKNTAFEIRMPNKSVREGGTAADVNEGKPLKETTIIKLL